MKISIIISTYNGEKYIAEQLESLRCQTRQPDEVIIRDDCSTDATVSIIQDYISHHKLYTWSFSVNERNCGWKRNFYNLMHEASGDLIFPCDQDDVWFLDKIDNMAQIMENNLNIMVLEGQPKKWVMPDNKEKGIKGWVVNILDLISEVKERSKNTGRIEKISFGKSFMRAWPGCALCIRKDLYNSIKDRWIEVIPHDAFVSLFAKMNNAYYRYDKEVIQWRKHISSTTRNVEKSSKNRISEIERDKEIIQLIFDYAKYKNATREVSIINGAICWNNYRKQLLTKGNPLYVILLIRYLSYYVQKRRILSDLIYGISNKNTERIHGKKNKQN